MPATGPVLKFYLVKAYGTKLRALGYEPQKMSCVEIIAANESADAESEYDRDLLLRSRNGQVGSGMKYR